MSSRGFPQYHRTLQSTRKMHMNTFHETVQCSAEKHAFDPHLILSLAEGCSSTDFCIDRQDIEDNEALGVLPQIIVDELRAHYDLHSQGPFQCVSTRQALNHNEKVMVFIASKLTDKSMSDGRILEHFDSAQRLYQYMNWTIRISKMAETMALMEAQNECNVLVVHTELHNKRRRDLYALCIPNDIVSRKAQKWQLAALLTATELMKLLGVDSHSLPRGVRTVSFQFQDLRRNSLGEIKQFIERRDSRGKPHRYQQIKCVMTNSTGQCTNQRHKNGENILSISLSAFCSTVRSALEDDKVELIPIVSIVAKRRRNKRLENFSVDYMLPVQIGQNCVGVVYRDGVPTQALMDCYDITNKALLCDPSFDAERVTMFQRNSTYKRLRIVPDHEWMRSRTPSMESMAIKYSPSTRPALIDIPSATRTLNSSRSLSVTPTESPKSYMEMSPTPSSFISSPPPSSMVPFVAPLPLLIPMPFVPVPSVNEVLQWTNQILLNGKHNQVYFEQFLPENM